MVAETIAQKWNKLEKGPPKKVSAFYNENDEFILKTTILY